MSWFVVKFYYYDYELAKCMLLKHEKDSSNLPSKPFDNCCPLPPELLYIIC